MALNKKFYMKLVILTITSFFALNSFAQREDNLIDAIQNRESAEPSDIEEAPQARNSAMRTHKHGFGIGLGQTILGGKYAKYGEDKITMDFFYTYLASYSFDLLVNFNLTSHEKNQNTVRLSGLSVDIKGRLYDFDKFSPYAIGGVGFYQPSWEIDPDNNGNFIESDKKTVFGINGGFGVDLSLNDRFSIGLLSILYLPFAVDQDQGPDVKGRYFKFLLTGFYFF